MRDCRPGKGQHGKQAGQDKNEDQAHRLSALDCGRECDKLRGWVKHHMLTDLTGQPISALPPIQRPMTIIIRFSVKETKPSGTFDDPPTQAHFNSRLSM